MNLFFISSESDPFVKTGSLGEFVYSYIKNISSFFDRAYLILPYYKQIQEQKTFHRVQETGLQVTVFFMNQPVTAEILIQKNEKYSILFIKKDEYYHRDELYSVGDKEYSDNAERIIFFNQAAVEVIKMMNPNPKIIHCIDWQTGLIPVYIKNKRPEDFNDTKVFFTINNILYQGLYSQFEMPLTNLGWDFFVPDKLEYYGKINFLKGGIIYSDAIVFPSQQYSKDVLKEENGCGLHQVFQKYKSKIHGIVTGMDNKCWNPETDKKIYQKYNIHSFTNRKTCKTNFINKYYHTNQKSFLIGMVSRLNKEKGIYFLLDIIDYLASKDIFLILTGTGDPKISKKIESKFSNLKNRFKFIPNPTNKFIREIFSASDILLKPPHHDPGGLSQLYAMRYGTLPFVSSIGGLRDTITDIFLSPDRGNGFCFHPGDTQDFIEKMEKILFYYRHYKGLWAKWQLNSMLHPYDMEHTASEYFKLYQSIN